MPRYPTLERLARAAARELRAIASYAAQAYLHPSAPTERGTRR